MLLSKDPNLTKAAINPSTAKRGKLIECDLARTLTLTLSCLYNASGTSSARVSLYYSPDGIHFDTREYAYFENTITAGARVQGTSLVDPPESGYLVPVVTNQDATYTITHVKLWAAISKYWEDLHATMSQYNSTRR